MKWNYPSQNTYVTIEFFHPCLEDLFSVKRDYKIVSSATLFLKKIYGKEAKCHKCYTAIFYINILFDVVKTFNG